ncbi:hypothetical protein CUMW_089550 [Citrus unshiu]|nr:hypothetical protein CUMW_089550 [Citrus unshiu]
MLPISIPATPQIVIKYFHEPTELTSPMLQRIEVISFSYPNLQDIRLSNVDMGIDMGTCVAIVGPNDTGKSPLPNLLADHLDTQSIVAVAVTLDEFAGGVVLVFGKEI